MEYFLIVVGLMFIGLSFSKDKFRWTIRIFGSIILLIPLLIIWATPPSVHDLYEKAIDNHKTKYIYDTQTEVKDNGETYKVFGGADRKEIGWINYTKYDDSTIEMTKRKEGEVTATINCGVVGCLTDKDLVGSGITKAFLSAIDANKSDSRYKAIQSCVLDKNCNDEVSDGSFLYHVHRELVNNGGEMHLGEKVDYITLMFYR